MARILSDTLQKNHSAPILSQAGFVTAVMYVFALVLPIYFITNTHNYWVNTAMYFEQPSVKHMNEILVFVQTDEKVYTFASTKSLNNLVDGSSENAAEISPEFQFLNHDSNHDGNIDQLEVKISMNTDGAKVRNVAILQTVVYSLDKLVNANMQVRFVNQFQTPNGVQRLAA
jgi:hypothetical protein